MTETTLIAVILLTVGSVLFLTASVVTGAYQDRSLHADVRWVYRVGKIYVRHYASRIKSI